MSHPCFDKGAHNRFGRMHLPVAPLCNIQCGYCDRRYNCVNESRPGVTASVTTPEEALNLAQRAARQMPNLSVAGIAGPGDPLANPAETLKTLRLIKNALPKLLLCLSTNGLALPFYVDELAAAGLTHLTVTVNAAEPETGAKIYNYVDFEGKRIHGRDGAELLLTNQLKGIVRAKALGLTVKVNMVVVPGINDMHTADVAQCVANAGADLMNCIPVAPVKGTRLEKRGEPDAETMAAARRRAEKWLAQMRHCGRCRADALGLLKDSYVLADAAHPERLPQGAL